MPQQVGPVVVDEVDEQPLDMRPVLILICHDHHLTIAKCLHRLGRLVFLLVTKTDDLQNVCDFGILHDLQVKKGANEIHSFC